MPPKPRITREMILNAAFAIVRERGMDAVNARTIAESLACSTQPVLYHFDSMEEIRREVYRMADELQTARLMAVAGQDPMTAIGLNYIRFAAEEKQLFRLLFQSDGFGGRGIHALLEDPEMQPVLEVFQRETELSPEQTKRVFLTLMMVVHGWASMLANNTMAYEEAEIVPVLEMAFRGMIVAVKMEDEQ